jgi:hypothetical protein
MRDLKDEFADIKQKASIEGTMNRIADMIDPEKPAAQAQPPAEPAAFAPEPVEPPVIEKAELPPVTTDVKP